MDILCFPRWNFGLGHLPVPWYGRVYMAGVTLTFAGVLAAAFRALGRPETRRYFGLVGPVGGATV